MRAIQVEWDQRTGTRERATFARLREGNYGSMLKTARGQAACALFPPPLSFSCRALLHLRVCMARNAMRARAGVFDVTFRQKVRLN